MNGHVVFVLVDSDTKWIEAVPMKRATADTTIDVLKGIFARFGLPETLVSDNGPQFSRAAMARFLKENHVCHLTTAPYQPQSNGLAERAVRTLIEGLRKKKDDTLQNRIAKFLFRYRCTPVKDGKSPSELLLAYQPSTSLTSFFLSGQEPEHAVALPTLSITKSPLLAPGTHVWSRQYQRGSRWLPGTVTSTQGRRMVMLNTPDGQQRWHVDQLRQRDAQETLRTQPEASHAQQTDGPTKDDQLARQTTAEGSVGSSSNRSEADPAMKPVLPMQPVAEDSAGNSPERSEAELADLGR